jgi:hypothetical protein
MEGGDVDPRCSDHRSREKREVEARGGRERLADRCRGWVIRVGAIGAYPGTHVREATGGVRAQENGAARFGGFFGAECFNILEE